jgi:hypothetical protein
LRQRRRRVPSGVNRRRVEVLAESRQEILQHLFAIDGLPARHRERLNFDLVRSQRQRDGDGIVGVGPEIGVDHNFLRHQINLFPRAKLEAGELTGFDASPRALATSSFEINLMTRRGV